jgi:hypothetical protein
VTKLTVLAIALAAAAALTGCGGQPGPQRRYADYDPSAAAASGAPAAAGSAAGAPAVCAGAAKPAPVPTAFPRELELPPEAVVTGSEERSGGRVIVTAVSPGTFRGVLAFMQHAYASGGLTLKEGEVEERDAESNFTGNGLTGRWTLREIPGCHGDTLVTVLAARS